MKLNVLKIWKRQLLLSAVTATLLFAGCNRSPEDSQRQQPMETEEQTHEYNKAKTELAITGESLLPLLNKQSDAIQGMTRYEGEIPHDGNTAYLTCGRLGEGGAVFMRLTMRHTGAKWLNVTNCTVSIEGKEIGSFPVVKGPLQKLPDGQFTEFLEADFTNIRPIILALVNAESATLHLEGVNGMEAIHLNPPQLEEMKKVLAAYEYLQAGEH